MNPEEALRYLGQPYSLQGKDLLPEETKRHPVWQYLARDQELLNEYVDVASRLIPPRVNRETCHFYILPSSAKARSPVIRPWALGAGDWGSVLFAGLNFAQGTLLDRLIGKRQLE